VTTESITAYAKERAGDALRVVARYDKAGYSVEHARSDLDRTDVDRRVAAVYDQLTWDWSPPEDEVMRAVGEAYATIQVRTDAVIVNLETGDAGGVLLSFSPSVTTDVVAFLGELLDRADADSASLEER